MDKSFKLGDILVDSKVVSQKKIKDAARKQKEFMKDGIYNRLGEVLVKGQEIEPRYVVNGLRKQRDLLIGKATIGSILVEMGKISEEQLTEALETHTKLFAPLGEILVEKGFCTPQDIDEALKRQVEIRENFLRRPINSNFEPINLMKLLVNEWVDELIDEYNGCTCDQCRADVIALSLNTLPPRYVSNAKSLLEQFDRYKDEYRELVQSKIIESIEYVKRQPKLSCRYRAKKIKGNIRGTVPVNVSNRHVHLTEEHLNILFGNGYQLKKWKDLVQPGQYAAQETVVLKGPKGKIERVRVLGPTRPRTQVEISGTDQFILGIKAPVRESGKLDGTPGVIIEGPAGTVELKEGVIRALRHIHMTPKDGEDFGVKNGDFVKVRLNGDRTTVLEGVLIRITDRSALEMHIDTDEANAAGVPQSSIGEVLL